MEATEGEAAGILGKLLPPRLEDAGLEDCALPPDAIKEAFAKAAMAVGSLISASSDGHEAEEHCVQDPSVQAGDCSDALVGITDGIDYVPGACHNEKGGGVPEVAGDEVAVRDGDETVDEVVVVLGDPTVPQNAEDACVDALQGLEIGQRSQSKLGKKPSDADVSVDDDSEEKDVEIPILTEDQPLLQKNMMSEPRIALKDFRSSAGCVIVCLLGALVVVSAEPRTEQGENGTTIALTSGYPWPKSKHMYHHVWPEMKFSWQIVVGTIISFFAAAFGSVGGVGGGGIFVPMLTLIIGFDPKSSIAISKCMITGVASASVYYNLRLRHPTLDLPVIDYDLALLFQPMLVLGISIGVAFNVIFADWMVTVLLILLFAGTSTKAFFKGVETWKKETIMKQEAAKLTASYGTSSEPVPYNLLPGGPNTSISMKYDLNKTSEVPIIDNMCWKELSILFVVWGTILFLHIIKNYTKTCSLAYWILNLLQIPIAIGASAYEAVCLYKGKRVLSSRGETGSDWSVHQLVLCCLCGIMAGIVGGLLGLGGGFILGPLLLELGVPPQVSSATATFAMAFSSSMSVVQYYLLDRFPLPYAMYFITVATVAALVGQHVVRKIVSMLGRASIIIFILAFTILVSAISLGGIGISNMIDKIVGKEYIGFEDICTYDST